jgi:hypothetical protein
MALAELSITPADVRYPANSPTSTIFSERIQFGETVTAFMPVYRDVTSGLYMKATNTDETESVVAGFAYRGGDTGEYDDLIVRGVVDLGAILTVGVTYFLSDTDGKIIPPSSIAVGRRVVRLGYATTTSLFQIDILNYGVVLGS